MMLANLALVLLAGSAGDLDEILQRADKAASSGDYSKALGILDEAEQREDVRWWTAYGTCSLRHAENQAASGQLGGLQLTSAFDEAAGALQKACKFSDAKPEAFVNWSEAEMNAGGNDLAIQAIDKGLAQHAASLAILLQAGRVHMASASRLTGEQQQQAYEKAAGYYSQAAETHDKDAVACVRLGEVRVWQGQMDAARDAWGQALDRDYSQVDLTQMSQWLRAHASPLFGKLRDRFRNQGQWPVDEATLYWYEGMAEYNGQPRRWVECKAAFNKALEINPQFLNTWFFLGQGAMDEGLRLQQAGDQGEADKAYRYSAMAWGQYLASFGANKLAEINAQEDKGETYVATMKWLSGKAYAGRDVDSAVKLSRWVVQARPRDGEAWNNLAFFLREGNLAEESLRAYRQALRLQPEDPQVMNDLAVILHYYLKKDDAEALSLYEKAAERAQAMLADESLQGEERQRIRIALRDARTNLAKLKEGNRNNF